MKNNKTKGHSTYAGAVCASLTVAGITNSAYTKAEEAYASYQEANDRLQKLEAKPTNVGICRLQEKVLRLRWAFEDAQEDQQALIESLQDLMEEGHEVQGNIFDDYNPQREADGQVANLIESLTEAVVLMHLPWASEAPLVGAEAMLQKGIGRMYSAIKSTKSLDKDLKGLILRGLQAYRGGKLRRDLNKSYKEYALSVGISWRTGDLI